MLSSGPILDKIRVVIPKKRGYPFSLKVVKNLKDLVFNKQVTFLVGENGTGKSTILEAVASRAGFGKEGGSKNISFSTTHEKMVDGDVSTLAECMTFSWRKKVSDGYFFRAESFFNLANEIDNMVDIPFVSKESVYASYGGTSLHNRSHGESFMTLFKNRIGKGGGFYLFDEPEAALSPQKQLALLVLLKELCKNKETQFIIATHSPILLAYPDADIWSFDGGEIKTIEYKDTEHYKITKGFLDNPEQFLNKLFSE